MAYTVRLCRDAAGWFATEQPVRAELVRAQVTTDCPSMVVFDVALNVARILDRWEDEVRVARAIARSPLFG